MTLPSYPWISTSTKRFHERREESWSLKQVEVIKSEAKVYKFQLKSQFNLLFQRRQRLIIRICPIQRNSYLFCNVRWLLAQETRVGTCRKLYIEVDAQWIRFFDKVGVRIDHCFEFGTYSNHNFYFSSRDTSWSVQLRQNVGFQANRAELFGTRNGRN